jgi:Ca2+-binding EF-hand superfamily protein
MKRTIAFIMISAAATMVIMGMVHAQPAAPKGAVVEEVFKKADTDNDSKLTLDEFKAALKDLRERIHEQHPGQGGAAGPAGKAAPGGAAAEMLRKADADKNKEVTREEFKAAFPNAPEGRFDALDRNKDGVLDQKDMPAAKASPGAGQATELIKTITKADTNGDGKVTFEELQAVRPGITKEAYNKLDKNGDGVLSKEDRPEPGSGPAQAAPGQKKPNKQDFQKKLKEADQNGDGKLSFEEAKTAFPNLTKEKFDKRDTNGDGFLSKEDRKK